MTSDTVRRQIADELRTNAKLVDEYLEYARRYANLCANHAEEVAKELFAYGHSDPDMVLLASLPLSKENPEQLRAKLEAVAKAANVAHVFVCRRTMTVYLFGSPSHDNHRTQRA